MYFWFQDPAQHRAGHVSKVLKSCKDAIADAK